MRLTRRTFAGFAALPLAARAAPAGPDLSQIPNFCSHEHWGSIDAIGMTPEGFRGDVEQGAVPHGRTGLLDLVFEPYLRGHIHASGDKAEVARWKTRTLEEILPDVRTAIARQRFTGTWQCTRRGMAGAHGVDADELTPETAARLDQSITRGYASIFSWYRQVMRKAGFSELIRPVHPEFYVRKDSAAGAAEEAAFTRTVMRIDPLLEIWRHDSRRRAGLAEITGVEPNDAASWRRFIGKLCDLAAAGRTLGIKQLQAYRRDLDFSPAADSEVPWNGGGSEAPRAFENWVVNECCRQAHDRGWVHQIHVGTHNITRSSPMPLEALAKRYPRMKVVMIHCWPFLDEAGWLAKYQPNMYIDTCWQPVLSPGFLRRALGTWLTYVPSHKITCAHDSTTIEMAYGSSLFTREILSEALWRLMFDLKIPETAAVALGADLLQNNAVKLYGMGQPFRV
ncbi:MAG: amidohydrolase family protein [Acidobacteria bacterium]|nr:amidohydrolase family protein [Acidobacteriota bacterium]